MSLLLVVRDWSETTPHAAGNAALASVGLQGFVNPERFSWDGGTAWLYPTPNNARGSGAWIRKGTRFAASTGAFHWRGLVGETALARLLANDQPLESLPLDEISGSFLILLGREDGVWLFGDAFGLMKAYEVAAEGVISTSFLACAAALKRRVVNRLRAQEYILLGATHGLETPVDGLRLLDPCKAYSLSGCKDVALYAPGRWRASAVPRSASAATEAVCEVISAEFRHLASGYGPNIGMALSGGFDSRLLLAALDHVGVHPDLYVYGRADDSDVVVANAVSRAIHRPIESIDKSALDRHLPVIDSTQLAGNMLFFDGLPIDGIYDRGSDRATRLKQVLGGRLNLNGGGGEILRNFFYLPDRSYTASDVFAAFYSGWLDEVFHSSDERRDFTCCVVDEILLSLGREHGTDAARAQPLARIDIELIYTLYRLRYWMGRNNSLSARYGAFMTPLVIPSLVTLAAAIPMAWKDFGRLEAQAIARLSPRVAAAPSSYGFSFDQGPGWRHMLKLASTMYRPVSLRHHSLRFQKWLGRTATPTVPVEWRDALGDEPTTDWLNPAALTRQDQLNRLMTLQAVLK